MELHRLDHADGLATFTVSPTSTNAWNPGAGGEVPIIGDLMICPVGAARRRRAEAPPYRRTSTSAHGGPLFYRAAPRVQGVVEVGDT